MRAGRVCRRAADGCNRRELRPGPFGSGHHLARATRACTRGRQPGAARVLDRPRPEMPPALAGRRLRLVGQNGSTARSCVRRSRRLRGVGHRRLGVPVLSRPAMQRAAPLPRVQPAHGWSGVERRNAFRRGVGRESLTRGYRGARLPDCRCNGTCRCRASNPRRVGLGRGAGTPLVVGARGAKAPARKGCNGRAKRLPCQACCITTHRLPFHLSRHFRLRYHFPEPIRFKKSATRIFRPESFGRGSLQALRFASCL